MIELDSAAYDMMFRSNVSVVNSPDAIKYFVGTKEPLKPYSRKHSQRFQFTRDASDESCRYPAKAVKAISLVSRWLVVQ